MEKRLVVIAGPTAVGKTETAIAIAKHFHTEIVSCDSRQIYRELAIGTAVPSAAQLNEVRHHFIHNISVSDYYNASIYENEALAMLEKLFEKYNLVVMAGGSGMYIDAVLHGIDDLPTIDSGIRKELAKRFESEGLEGLRQELKKVDPEYYGMVDLKNPKRIQKALEVFTMTGKPYSAFLTGNKKERRFKPIFIVLDRDREELHQRINQRVEDMVVAGLASEAQSVWEYKGLNSLNTVGYKEIFDFLEGNITLNEAKELIKRNTRRYARRQISWFRRYKNTAWFHPENTAMMIDYIIKNANLPVDFYEAK